METETVMMPRSLTAENGAKALMIGEFKEYVPVPCPDCIAGEFDGDDEGCLTCDGEGELQQEVTVSWTTIKEIYAMAVKHLAT